MVYICSAKPWKYLLDKNYVESVPVVEQWQLQG